MMPPYGAPYAAIYPHGGVYAHPGVPLVSIHSFSFFFFFFVLRFCLFIIIMESFYICILRESLHLHFEG